MFGVGDTVGHYEIASRLSEGGMATLFFGRRTDEPNAPPAAIKVIHEHLSEDWQFVRMFVDEALISVRLRHPNVVRVDELGEQDNVYYLVMEYVHGCSLAQLLRAMGRQGRRMRPEIAIWIAQQVAAGLHAAHEMTGHDGQVLGVIHRDVSPQNVLLSVDGEVKLLDFGIAKARGRAERTEAGVIKGKVRYMAPEQATGQEIDRRIDIYALGVVLWEMLTMRRYIDGKTDVEILRKVQQPELVPPSARAQGIDPRIDDAVMAALAVSLDARPPTAAHLYHMLAAALPEGTVGPTHVAELLRLFVADELEAAARALPEDVAGPLAARCRTPAPSLPGEARAQSDDGWRVETLTSRLNVVAAQPTVGEDAPTKSGKIRAEPRAAEPPPGAAEEHVIDVEPVAPEPVEPMRPSRLPHVGHEDEEATVASSEDELASFLESLEVPRDRHSEPPTLREPAVPRVAPEAMRPVPAPPAGPAPPPVQIPPTARSRPGMLAWIVRAAVVVAVAFAVGAGIAVAYVRFIAH